MKSHLVDISFCVLILYFIYHAITGEQGLGRWRDLQSEIDSLQTELYALHKEKAEIERDIARLSATSLDPDYIEELARNKLTFVYPDEKIYAFSEGGIANMQDCQTRPEFSC